MKYIPIAFLLFTSGCASKFIDRRADESLQQNRQWQRNEDVSARQTQKVDERKVNKRVKRTPVLTPSGTVATLPSGEPAIETEETIEQTDTSMLSETEILRKLQEAEEAAKRIERIIQERERRMHNIQLIAIAVAMAGGLACFIYLAIKRKWVFGWFW